MCISDVTHSLEEIQAMMRDNNIDPHSTAGKIFMANNFSRIDGSVEPVRDSDRVFVETAQAVKFDPLIGGLAAEIYEAGDVSAVAALSQAATQLEGKHP